MALFVNKLNAAGLTPEDSMQLPTRTASAEEERVLQAFLNASIISDDDLASVFAPELIYTAPDGQDVVGKVAVAAKLRERTQIEAYYLLETPTMLPSNTVVLDTHTAGGVRHLVVMKRRAGDGLVSSISDEESHRKALAPPMAARAMKTSVQSPTDMMMSPCTSKLNLVKRRHLMKAKPTNLFAHGEPVNHRKVLHLMCQADSSHIKAHM